MNSIKILHMENACHILSNSPTRRQSPLYTLLKTNINDETQIVFLHREKSIL